MPWMIETFDKPGCAELRSQLRPEHLDYLEANKSLLLACGAKLDDEGEGASGGLYLLDVNGRAQAQSFIEQDPFFKGNLFARVVVTRWRKAYLDRRNTLNEG
ncbi:YciI family protein [Qingshengfaniella alkalisoli]|uniref:YciI family protein n=1 Tax=Qingshengfaniella alkalisoli TaxID=2599296 RepID=A0A5B8IB68_9RHOB|nr:YciI family protein [Qingshengfaniella alkalisoli]QDY70636.1 YciI family protein [Qingshengfaniella alkalisoli]